MAITFSDFFAGMGGIRLGLEQNGMQCVFSCEKDKHACQIYQENFHNDPFGDITILNPNDIPDFDVLTAGFPCQSFSLAGKQLGFEDSRGTLFFDLCRIIENKKTKVLLLENVKNLQGHDSGRTFGVIYSTLKDLGYNISYKILNAIDFGVPQSRERIIIIGYLQDHFQEKHFDFNTLNTTHWNNIESILEPIEHEIYKKDYYLLENPILSRNKLLYAGHLNKPNRLSKGFRMEGHKTGSITQQARIYSSQGVHPTMCRNSSSRPWILHNNQLIKLTMQEYFRLFGFPDDFKKVGTQTELFARLGNSVCVPMFKEIASKILI